MNTKNIGDKAEINIIAKCINKNWIVLQPFGDNQLYDIVINRGNGFERVQIKNGLIKNGAVRAYTRRTVGTTSKSAVFTYSIKEIDLIAIWCDETQKGYLIPVVDCVQEDGFTVQKSINLRVDPPKLKKQNCRFAEVYRI